jgi:hypothetical protein
MIINGKEIKSIGNCYYLLTILYNRRNSIKKQMLNKKNIENISINMLEDLGNKIKESNLMQKKYFSNFSENSEFNISKVYDSLILEINNDEYIKKSNISEEVKYFTDFHRKYIKNHTQFFNEEINKNNYTNELFNANISGKYGDPRLSNFPDICLETINPLIRLAAYCHIKSIYKAKV